MARQQHQVRQNHHDQANTSQLPSKEQHAIVSHRYIEFVLDLLGLLRNPMPVRKESRLFLCKTALGAGTFDLIIAAHLSCAVLKQDPSQTHLEIDLTCKKTVSVRALPCRLWSEVSSPVLCAWSAKACFDPLKIFHWRAQQKPAH